MKITCSKGKLHSVITKAEKITGKNATLPVLSCLVLEAKGSNLFIRSTNLDLGIEIKIPVKVEKEGVVAIPGSLFVQYISNISDDENVTIESVNENLLVTSSKNETTIKALSHEDFPTIPQLENTNTCTILSQSLLHGLKSVWYSASVSSMKPELSSVYLYPKETSLMFVATDSFRLAEKRVETKELENFESVLIPFRNVSEIVRVFDDTEGDVEVRFGNGQVAFIYDGIYLVSRIVDGTFPDYSQIIPKENTTEVIVLKQDLMQALKLSNIFSDNFNKVSMVVKPNDGIFELISKNIDKGENKNLVEGTLRGEDIEISFNHKHLSDSFSSINSDSLTLTFNGNSKPVVMKGVGDPSFLYLTMPLNK
ncbi:DNA polymerase III subunit beta [Candidatus Pacebacteria bacterium]|nr:DNA polymerase III subunit beta [Candidatus Paceibacterota bacterium]